MASDSTWRRLPVWVMALLGAALAVAAIATFGGTSQAQAAQGVDLRITKSIKPRLVTVGETQTYTIRITNDGNTRARGVTMTDPLPGKVRFIRASTSRQVPGSCGLEPGRVVECNLGRLAPGKTVTVKIYVKTVEAGRYTNRAFVGHSGSALELDPSDNSDTATHRAVKDDGGDRQRDGGGKKKGGRCGVEARAGNDGARACVGGVKAGANG